MKFLKKFLIALVLTLSLSTSAQETLTGACTIDKELIASHQGCCPSCQCLIEDEESFAQHPEIFITLK